ncbi:MAG: glutamine-hydrolyzing carbamoyl-phosphate synthase small subunit [Alphaproteobacteria bacterium]|nr:glutamine-hydrolyzing carbamoyl-phosphate synthase small subunit [Alphaproteobacteria bacterium]
MRAKKKRFSRGFYRAKKYADAVLVLEDGQVFYGKGAGHQGIAVGELCFNTAMTGHQEILSDPSYAGQIINFTTPHIGNVGSNKADMETFKPFALGMVVTELPSAQSNYRAKQNFDEWLQQHKLIAIAGIDTRALTHYIRDKGAPKAVLCYQPNSTYSKAEIDRLQQMARDWQGLNGMDLSKDVTTDKVYSWQEMIYSLDDAKSEEQTDNDVPHIVVIDYGAKHNILRHLSDMNAKVSVVSASYAAQEIIKMKPDGVMLSNGPGDPAATGIYAVPIVQELLKCDFPIFGICLGYQIMALSLGAKTEKMACGHRGANHPVKNLLNGAVEITSQNHGFQVMKDSLPANIEATHISLFDKSLEGIRLKDKPVFAVQYHPEASPGPHDSHYLFKQFYEMVQAYRASSTTI